jgi:HAD superfamily hydrolase (TIGR01509 family)
VITAVLFDGDQTLWDFEKVMRQALETVLSELRVARPGAAADALTTGNLYDDRAEVADELAGIEFNLAQLRRLGFMRTLSRLPRPAVGSDDHGGDDEALAAQLCASYFDHRDRDPALFDDTLPCLEALGSRYRLGLLSNGSRLPDSIGLGGIFEAVIFAQDHQVAKPERGIFAVAEELMHVAPEETVLIGDHPLNDVIGAKRSGWRAVWLDRKGEGPYVPPTGYVEKPDAVITSLSQLPEVLATF